eukprot:884604-Amphidinium_carterae.1
MAARAPEASINLPFIAQNETGPKTIQRTLTRDEFNRLSEVRAYRCIQLHIFGNVWAQCGRAFASFTKDLLRRCKEPVDQALEDAGLSSEDSARACCH